MLLKRVIDHQIHSSIKQEVGGKLSVKILYIDTDINGHHQAYLKELLKDLEEESVVILPERVDWLRTSTKQYIYAPIDLHKKKILSFIQWMKELAQYVEYEKPDVVHLLNGDVFYKFFGLGLHHFAKYSTVMTLHWVRPGKVQRFSLKVFCQHIDKIIVHSEFLQNEMSGLGINNVAHIEYPQFKQDNEISPTQAKAFWKLKQDIPVIVCLGNTRYDKGLDILLEALTKVDKPFQILIAGKEESFDKAFIERKTHTYTNKVTTVLRYLTDAEVDMLIAAADIIALPYRNSFNGASGPLAEGVSKGKCIIGSAHGNLGYTIKTNHLGYVFNTEDPDDLARVLTEALTVKFQKDKKYKMYQDLLQPSNFRAAYKKVYKELLAQT